MFGNTLLKSVKIFDFSYDYIFSSAKNRQRLDELYGNLSLLSYPTNRRMWFLLSDVFSSLCISKILLTKTLHIPNSKTGNKCNGHILGQLEIKVSYLLGYLRHCRGMKKYALEELHVIFWHIQACTSLPCGESVKKIIPGVGNCQTWMGHFRGIIGFRQQMAPEVSLFHFSNLKVGVDTSYSQFSRRFISLCRYL